jgi:hypothetical protein
MAKAVHRGSEQRMVRQPCHVAEQMCENPAGWGGSYGIIENHELKEIPCCGMCGLPCCRSCSVAVAGGRRCNECVREVGLPNDVRMSDDAT